MGRGVIYYIFQRPRFCCCLPVRICVIIMSLLGIILSGLLSIVCWFEVSRGDALTSEQRAAFIGGAIVSTLLLLISIVGLVGAIVRKLTLATTYAVGLYIHFLINLIVATYLLFVILHTTHTDTVALCQNVLVNQQSKDQCNSIFDSIRRLYAGIAFSILTVELYGAIVATRYVYQLRGEKREARMPKHMRLQSDSGQVVPGIMRYTDSSGATVYSSSHQLMRGHARGASAYSLVNSDFEEGYVDLPSAGLHDMESHEALGSEDEYQDDEHGYEAHNRNAPEEEGAFSTVQSDVTDIEL